MRQRSGSRMRFEGACAQKRRSCRGGGQAHREAGLCKEVPPPQPKPPVSSEARQVYGEMPDASKGASGARGMMGGHC